MLDQIAAFLLAALALVGSPGPATLSLAATGAAFGAGRGVALLVGLMTGIVVVMAVAASGVTGLLLALPGAAEAVGLAAAAYILYLAWRIATAPPLAGEGDSGRTPTAVDGLVLQLLNPKAYAAMAALFSGFVLLADAPLWDALAKMAVLWLVVLVGNVAWLCAGAGLTRVFRSPRANRAINVVFAVSLVASVALTLLL